MEEEIPDLVFSPAWLDVNKATVHNAVNGQGQSRLVFTDRQVKNLQSVKVHAKPFDTFDDFRYFRLFT